MASPKTHQSETNAVAIQYNILWMSTAVGKQEPTTGCIEITSLPSVLDNHGSLCHRVSPQHAPVGFQEDILLADTAKSSVEPSDTSGVADFEFGSAPTTKSSSTSTHVIPGIPCIAKLSWGPWVSTFYCSYDPLNDSFRSRDPSSFAFGIQSMNEWMEMQLMGSVTMVPRLICEGVDDHGHDFLILIVIWNWGGPKVSRLFAKRETGNRDRELRERECGSLGIEWSTPGVEKIISPDQSHQSGPENTIKPQLSRQTSGERRHEGQGSDRGRNNRATFRGGATFRSEGGFRGGGNFRARGDSSGRGDFRDGRPSGDRGRQRGGKPRGRPTSRTKSKTDMGLQRDNSPKVGTLEAKAQMGADDTDTEDLIIL